MARISRSQFFACAAGFLSAAFALGPAETRAQAPPNASVNREAMTKLAGLVGTWEGEASITMGPGGPRKVHQKEVVRSKLDGTVLYIEGTGTESGADGQPKVVFQALAVAAYDAQAKGYKFHAFRDTGSSTVADAEVTADGMKWGFEDGRGGKIRYTITLKGDTWNEVGDYIAPGQPPRRFFEMTVKRVPEP